MTPVGVIMDGNFIYTRGVPLSAAENAIKYGSKALGNDGGIIHTYENVVV